MENVTNLMLPLAFPDKREQTIPVVFAANESFIPPCGTAIYSIFANSSRARYYDIIILGSDIQEETKNLLCGMFRTETNFSIRFINAAPLVQNYDLQAHYHITVETFYRFLIQELLPDYDKVLYLDGDLICEQDVAKLYDMDVDGFLLAAVRDPDMLGNLNLKPRRVEYLRQELKMAEPYDYFQAGVLLMNLKEMRRAYSVSQWLEYATHPYLYSDQDVLNRYCQGKVLYLDMAWNVLMDLDNFRVSEIISAAPENVRQAYMDSRKNPKIVHFAGYRKPWKYPDVDFAPRFWKYARYTPWHEQMLLDVVQQMQKDTSFHARIKAAFLRVRSRLLPQSLRQWIKKQLGQEDI